MDTARNTGAEIADILREGGEYWAVYVWNEEDDEPGWRLRVRETTEEEARASLRHERIRRPDRSWRARHVKVEVEELRW